MKKEEVDQMFNGRWRLKTEHIEEKLETLLISYRVDYVKELCRDFFEAGIALSEVPSDITTVEDAANRFAKEDFEYWWSIYDKKRGKEKCMQKWAKLSVDERKACIKATPSYVASTPDKAYRKDPLTYLNGKCWNDEIIIKNGTDKQQQQRERLTEVANRIAEYTKNSK